MDYSVTDTRDYEERCKPVAQALRV